ncbi:MAG TPA: hypothetical protein VGP48_09940 [Stellaceae bacterium]|jgi:hypothetical protein|nr:hypothetical protein [Stellaceae bacterium]
MYPGKPAVLWLKRRAWPIAILVIVICAAFWAGTRYERGWRVAVIAPPQPGLSDAQMFPASKPVDFSDLVPGCTFPPPNGAILYTVLPIVRAHTLEIMNGTKGDAIIKVRDPANGHLVESVFVADGETADIPNLPNGSYRIQYAFGALASDCRSLVKPAASEFPDIEVFAPGSPGVSYTLYATPKGNVRPSDISADDFDAP